MRLYVDGVQVGTRSDVVKGQTYEGVWRIGGDNNSGWPDRSTSWNYFAGTIDDVADLPTGPLGYPGDEPLQRRDHGQQPAATPRSPSTPRALR